MKNYLLLILVILVTLTSGVQGAARVKTGNRKHRTERVTVKHTKKNDAQSADKKAIDKKVTDEKHTDKKGTDKKGAEKVSEERHADPVEPGDDLTFTVTAEGDTIELSVAPEDRHGPLTEEDFREVAEEMGVEVAAIKAVVEIEGGRSHQGFWTEGKPVINFDATMFRRMARMNHVNLGKYHRSHAVVFARPNAARYGSQQAAQQARLDAARSIHDLSAIQGTFWGMFQIGGFNWKKCGTASAAEFVELMSRSERDQLELFATFVRNSGLLDSLRKKNWRTFARGYNGPGYASRGYHTRLANAYSRFKRAESTEK